MVRKKLEGKIDETFTKMTTNLRKDLMKQDVASGAADIWTKRKLLVQLLRIFITNYLIAIFNINHIFLKIIFIIFSEENYNYIFKLVPEDRNAHLTKSRVCSP